VPVMYVSRSTPCSGQLARLKVNMLVTFIRDCLTFAENVPDDLSLKTMEQRGVLMSSLLPQPIFQCEVRK
jgi:hypothetical protein